MGVLLFYRSFWSVHYLEFVNAGINSGAAVKGGRQISASFNVRKDVLQEVMSGSR